MYITTLSAKAVAVRIDADLLVRAHSGQVQSGHLLHGVGLDFNAFDHVQYCLGHSLSVYVALL